MGDDRGLILSNKAEISQEGKCGRLPEDISAQSTLTTRKLTLNIDEFRGAQAIAMDSSICRAAPSFYGFANILACRSFTILEH